MEVEVIRSARRQKTVQARQVGGKLRISIPATLTQAEEARWIDEMTRRFERRAQVEPIDLVERAGALARQYGLPAPTSIRWVENQHNRWGSCTTGTGAVRISTALASFPRWVLDYVIVHELAHLVEPSHRSAFWALVARYPHTERARGYLIAKGVEPDG
ncbi:MAG: M48 metallopeptidase family protein [Egibacteraceae bacterium]